VSYIPIETTQFEIRQGALCGVERKISSLERGLRTAGDASGKDDDSWTHDIEGALGEMAAAKALNIYWGGSVDTFKKELDIDNFEIRTRSEHWMELFVRPHEPDDRWYMLVTGEAPSFRIVGIMRGKDAKREDWLKNHGGGKYKPAYFVPTNQLIPIERVVKKLDRNRAERRPEQGDLYEHSG